jgi:hypothetical protein
MLASRASYEIWQEVFPSRLTLAMRRATHLHAFPPELYRPLGLDPNRLLSAEDTLWLRVACSDPTGKRIRALRTAASQTEVLSAAQLLSEWYWNLRECLPDDQPDDPETLSEKEPG